VRQLKEHMSEMLRLVQKGEIVEVTNRGEVIARVVPARKYVQPDKQDLAAFWTDIDTLAAEIGTYLPEKVDAVEIMHDVRRDL
jgi:prevent-host-death family protein